MPITRSSGKPVKLAARWVISSSGLLTMTSVDSGACVRMPLHTDSMMAALTAVRSVRLIPGCRGLPAVTMMYSAPLSAARSSLPLSVVEKPYRPAPCQMSSARPAARPGTTSTSATLENRSLWASRSAAIAPTWPAPTTAAFGRLAPPVAVDGRGPHALRRYIAPDGGNVKGVRPAGAAGFGASAAGAARSGAVERCVTTGLVVGASPSTNSTPSSLARSRASGVSRSPLPSSRRGPAASTSAAVSIFMSGPAALRSPPWRRGLPPAHCSRCRR